MLAHGAVHAAFAGYTSVAVGQVRRQPFAGGFDEQRFLDVCKAVPLDSPLPLL